MEDPKATLLRYLRRERAEILAKVDGLGEYDVRRPLTRTGTNVLGVVKHVASVQLGYLHHTFGGEPVDLPWLREGAEVNADMWVTADESRQDVLDLFRRSSQLSDATVAPLDLDATGAVPWWPPERRTITVHLALVHMLDEMARHCGQLDIVRELIDGEAGDLRGNLPNLSEDDWTAYRARIEAAAVEAARRADTADRPAPPTGHRQSTTGR